jgi:RNA polymerase sigma-70 factor (ECF subfamily)
MMNLCLRYTSNEPDAKEALNSAFYKVFRGIENYNPQRASLYTWIAKIVINTCLNLLRVKPEPVQSIVENDNNYNAIASDAILKMNADEILEILRQLPPATNAVFNLFAIEGYSHKEIAQMMNISEGTSKWHMSEARKQLQKMIHTKRING